MFYYRIIPYNNDYCSFGLTDNPLTVVLLVVDTEIQLDFSTEREAQNFKQAIISVKQNSIMLDEIYINYPQQKNIEKFWLFHQYKLDTVN